MTVDVMKNVGHVRLMALVKNAAVVKVVYGGQRGAKAYNKRKKADCDSSAKGALRARLFVFALHKSIIAWNLNFCKN